MKKTDVQKLMESNPKADKELVEQAFELLDELDAAGVETTTYNLSPPFARPYLTNQKCQEADNSRETGSLLPLED